MTWRNPILQDQRFNQGGTNTCLAPQKHTEQFTSGGGNSPRVCPQSQVPKVWRLLWKPLGGSSGHPNYSRTLGVPPPHSLWQFPQKMTHSPTNQNLVDPTGKTLGKRLVRAKLPNPVGSAGGHQVDTLARETGANPVGNTKQCGPKRPKNATFPGAHNYHSFFKSAQMAHHSYPFGPFLLQRPKFWPVEHAGVPFPPVISPKRNFQHLAEGFRRWPISPYGRP